MTLKDCRGVELAEGDFVIYVVQGNRNAGIEFGYILEVKDKSKTHEDYRTGENVTMEDYSVKIQHANFAGVRKNVTVVDHPGYWRADTPQRVLDYVNNRNRSMEFSEYWAAREEYWIEDTFKDSGKPSTTRINCGGQEHRLFKTQPV